MKTYERHRWNVTYEEASRIQHELCRKVRLKPLSLRKIRFVAGTDIAVSKTHGRMVAAAVVHEFPSLDVVETRFAIVPLVFPYIPGFLSFREIPALIACLHQVSTPVDVVLCDGHGVAHPRGLGLASHLGLLIRKPTVGCAKSVLVGEFRDVNPKRGHFSPLVHKGVRVGSALRTRDDIKPVFVSPGHLIDQASSRRVVLACATRYRLPEPTRTADRLAGVEKRRFESSL